MENESGVSPLGRAVLVEYYMPERKGSLIALPPSVESRDSQVEQRARVVEAGPACWSDEAVPRAVPGDYVLISKMAGYACTGPKDKKPYRLVNDRDVFAKLTHIEE